MREFWLAAAFALAPLVVWNSPAMAAPPSNGVKAQLLATPACADSSTRNPFWSVCEAVKSFCSTSTGLACSLYQEDAVNCDRTASVSYQALLTLRLWTGQGVTKRQAVEMTVQAGIDADATAEAAGVSDSITEFDYHATVLRQCLRATAER